VLIAAYMKYTALDNKDPNSEGRQVANTPEQR
jgi:hypothetical protein